MPQLKELIQNHVKLGKAVDIDKELRITPGPEIPWQPVGPGKEHLLAELEKLYWDGAKRELDNIIDTLRSWDKDPLPSNSSTLPREKIDGCEDFIANVTRPGRVYAEAYSKMKDELDTQLNTLTIPKAVPRRSYKYESWLQLDVYEQVTQHLLVHQKMQRIQKKLKKDVESRIPVVNLPNDGSRNAWLLLQAAGFLDIDKMVEYRTPRSKSAALKRPGIPQLSPVRINYKRMVTFKPQRCLQPGCKDIILASMFTSSEPKEPRLVCETCYRSHHYGKESYGKVYKHSILDEVMTAKAVKRICNCPDSSKRDKTRNIKDSFPYSPNMHRHCRLWRVGDIESRAMYDGLLKVVGRRPGSKLSAVAGRLALSSRISTGTGTGTEKTVRESAKKEPALGAASESGLAETITDPAPDHNTPGFFAELVDKDAFGEVHMSLRVGPLVIENGVENAKDGALVTMRELPVFEQTPKDAVTRALAVDGTARSVWKQDRPCFGRKRYKTIMKQVVGNPFRGAAITTEELNIIALLRDASQQQPPGKAKAGADEAKKDSVSDGIREKIMVQLKALLGERLKIYLCSIVDLLLDSGTDLTWHPKKNTCQRFCNSLLDKSLFQPLFCGPEDTEPLYVMSFICQNEGYGQPVIRSKHDVPLGFADEYLQSLYCRRFDESDLIDTCKEYWHLWAGIPERLGKSHCDLFPYDCTRAYKSDKHRSEHDCGTGCTLARHLWASPFDAWAMTSMHLQRDHCMYPLDTPRGNYRDPRRWTEDRTLLLEAACTLSLAASAMASSPALRKATEWLHSDTGLGIQGANLDRVKTGGIHRAQPFSHLYDKGSHGAYFRAGWAAQVDRAHAYQAMRDRRAKQGDHPGVAGRPRNLAAPQEPPPAAKSGYRGFGGGNSWLSATREASTSARITCQKPMYTPGGFPVTTAMLGDRFGPFQKALTCGSGCGSPTAEGSAACGSGGGGGGGGSGLRFSGGGGFSSFSARVGCAGGFGGFGGVGGC